MSRAYIRLQRSRRQLAGCVWTLRRRRDDGRLPPLGALEEPLLLFPLFLTSLYSYPQIGTAKGEVISAEPDRLADADSIQRHSEVYIHGCPRM